MAVRKRPTREGLARMKETGCEKDDLPASMITWLADYRDGSGARRFKQFRTQTEAKAFEKRASVDVADGKHVPESQSKTVAGAAELWLKVCCDGDPTGEPAALEESTWREYERHVRYLTDPKIGIGKLKLTQLSLATVDAFLQRLREQGRTAATARKVRNSLAILLGFAQDKGMVSRNVLRERRRRRKAERDRKEIVMPTKEHLRALLGYQGPLWWRAFLTTAIYTGMRASEIRGLDWRNVDLKAGVIEVCARADFAGRIGAPKSKAGNRKIDMTPAVRKLLQELRLSSDRVGGLVFGTRSGAAMSHSNIVRRFFEPMQVLLGIADPKLDEHGKPVRDPKTKEPVMIARYKLHALRHAAASLFIEQGWTPKKVQAIMGHSSIQVTYDVYGKLFKNGDDDQAAMAALDASLRA